MAWYDVVRVVLYTLWFVMAGLVVKLLVVRRRWRHPLRGNGPMLVALLLILVNTEITRARNIGAAPPPYLPSVITIVVATLLVLWWLWRQMELIPRWIREHVPWHRKQADYSWEEHVTHSGKAAAGPDDAQQVREGRKVESKDWPPRSIETK